ncbi:MAG: lysostaphin resistance A-like protein [Eubacterium sp.]
MKEKVSIGRVWGAFYPALLYLLLQFVVSIGYQTVLSVNYAASHTSLSESELKILMQEYLNNRLNQDAVMLTLICAAIITPIVVILFWLDNKKDKKAGRYCKYYVDPMKFLLIIPMSIFGMFAGSYFSSLCAVYMPESWIASFESVEEALYGGNIIVQFIGIAIIGPIAEELIFRGMCYVRLKRFTNVLVAAIISSVFFGIFHGNVVQGIYATLLGLMLVFVYEKYKSIWAPIIFHMTSNCISLMISTAFSTISTGDEAISSVEMAVACMIYTIIFGVLLAGIITIMAFCVKPQKEE